MATHTDREPAVRASPDGSASLLRSSSPRSVFRAQSTLSWEQIGCVWCGADIQVGAGRVRTLCDRIPILRQVGWQRAGLDGVPVSVLQERGVPVISSGDLTSRWVAETVIACIAADARFLPLAARNRIPPLDRFTRGFTGLRVAVVGTGHIGRAVWQMASSIGMQVTGLTRDPMRVDANRAVFANLRPFPEDLATTAGETDYLVLALPATDSTCGIINARILGELGPAGVLVNLARPSIVDEAALLAALRRGSLRAAYVSRLERSANWVPWRSALPDHLFLTFDREAHVAEKMERAAQQFAALLQERPAGPPRAQYRSDGGEIGKHGRLAHHTRAGPWGHSAPSLEVSS
ncbi:MAG: NAD(P)-dependent oxidoreductase [Gemmatimonadota bacterium]|nr:NAD(P)-dependent oxidoreductase [Gemmatimonadota bacterium]